MCNLHIFLCNLHKNYTTTVLTVQGTYSQGRHIVVNALQIEGGSTTVKGFRVFWFPLLYENTNATVGLGWGKNSLLVLG